MIDPMDFPVVLDLAAVALLALALAADAYRRRRKRAKATQPPTGVAFVPAWDVTYSVTDPNGGRVGPLVTRVSVAIYGDPKAGALHDAFRAKLEEFHGLPVVIEMHERKEGSVI